METAKREPDVDVASDETVRPQRDSISASESRIEELVAEISRTIRAAEAERRAGLKELAETLLHDEVASIVDIPTPHETAPRHHSSNPLLAGLLLILVGLGFLVIVPLVGLTLAFIGVVLAAWGGFISWFRK
jgi:hypothetical protein